jgi:hypothetical protein
MVGGRIGLAKFLRTSTHEKAPYRSDKGLFRDGLHINFLQDGRSREDVFIPLQVEIKNKSCQEKLSTSWLVN